MGDLDFFDLSDFSDVVGNCPSDNLATDLFRNRPSHENATRHENPDPLKVKIRIKVEVVGHLCEARRNQMKQVGSCIGKHHAFR